MNGTGIFGTCAETPIFFQKLKSLLNPSGQILIDSSDIIYMFDKDDVPSKHYYGELTFSISYKNQIENAFPWLYLDYDLLKKLAFENDLNCELIENGDHFDYLARLTSREA
jgi:hypothetical protein